MIKSVCKLVKIIIKKTKRDNPIKWLNMCSECLSQKPNTHGHQSMLLYGSVAFISSLWCEFVSSLMVINEASSGFRASIA